MSVNFVVDGRDVSVDADGISLLEALRDHLGVRSAKDGCSPQGQCGCCTVLVDGQPRVSCVTPLARVEGRSVTSVDGLDPAVRDAWARALCATGGSQCGFCTPGIVVRLSALSRTDHAAVDQALLAHLCRCTGWQTIHEAAALVHDGAPIPVTAGTAERLALAERRAALEGRTTQRVHPDVALGRGGFADDLAPVDALVAVLSPAGEWVVADTLAEARRRAGKVQGRRTTEPLTHPIEPPPGDWVFTVRTTWVEPAYLEPDTAWCLPGGEPVGPLTNGGAFGAKAESGEASVAAVARRLADDHGRAVRVLYAREDAVRLGAKRPPLAAGVRADGTGTVRVARTPGVAAAIAAVAPDWVVEEVDVDGPPTSASARAAGWAEVAALRCAASGEDRVVSPDGAVASARIDDDGVHVTVRCGEVLDAVVLRSYCIGAAHMALGWVRNEGLAVDGEGVVHDLTVRSFGVLRAIDTPPIHVTIVDDPGEPVNGSDAVFAAVAAAAWRAAGHPPAWPTAR